MLAPVGVVPHGWCSRFACGACVVWRVELPNVNFWLNVKLALKKTLNIVYCYCSLPVVIVVVNVVIVVPP